MKCVRMGKNYSVTWTQLAQDDVQWRILWTQQ